MLNHYRTLLVNLTAGPLDGITGFLEEPIPSSFAPVQLSSAIKQVRRLFFGTDPDREFINYRARQIMPLLRAHRFADFLTYHDSRTLYRDTDVTVLPRTVTAATANDPDSSLSLSGVATAQDAAGFMRLDYAVRVIDGTSILLDRLRPNAASVSYTYSLNEVQTSELFPLLGSGLNFRLHAPVINDRWEVNILARPQRDIGALIAQTDLLTDATVEQLFGAATTEPYRTFYNLWATSRESADRLMGIMSALVFRSNDLLRRQNG